MDGRSVADRLYGEIHFNPLVASVSSTPDVFRLDDVRQLGACFLVYPSATHTRREHSLGVCHLAGQIARRLRALVPHLVDEDDILCVELAGLLHDVGHGPLSHTFEAYMSKATTETWSHEEMGVAIARGILTNPAYALDLASHFRGDIAKNLAFVDHLILGVEAAAPWPEEETGRPPSKRFLSEIVHARSTGIDADKLDYLARDAMAVFGATNPLPISRIVAAVRVVSSRLAFDRSVASDVAEVFRLRARMHKQVYQLRACVAAEEVVIDLMAAIDASLPEGSRLVDAARDPGRLALLSDANVLRVPFGDVSLLSEGEKLAYASLYRRPWFVDVPVSALLHTRPLCLACSLPTAPEDRYCPSCGASTKGRKGVPVHEGREVLISPPALITARDAVKGVRGIAEQNGVPSASTRSLRAHVVDVRCGSAVVIDDPHDGRQWRDFDPLREVLFVSRFSQDSVVRVSSESHFPPSMTHVRLVHFFLSPSEATAVACVSDAVREWANGVGRVA